MQSRRVILNDSPNRNTRTGTYIGKAAPVPMHDAHSWRNPGGPVGSPAGTAQQKSRQGKPNKAQKNAGGNVLRVPLRRGRRSPLGQWGVDGEIHKLPVMAALRDELYLQMRSLHSRYDCVRKVMTRNPDLQKPVSYTHLTLPTTPYV